MSRRILILGAAGFVGRHLRAGLTDRLGPGDEVIATSLEGVPGDGIRPLDLTDGAAVREALRRTRPSHVINLAGIAAPVAARNSPALAWQLHALSPEALGRSILDVSPDCWLFHVSSGLVYGGTAGHGRALTEDDPLDPGDPYGVTKAAGDLAVGALAREGLNCLRLRPFNHIGPGQAPGFAAPDFAARLARIATGSQPPRMGVGNLRPARDFLDVRDVVDAYIALIERTGGLVPGTVYNVASGQATPVGAILDRLIAISGLDVTVEPDPALQRPADLPVISGSSARLTADTGWQPRRPIAETLTDIYREALERARG